jgi:predicted ATP-grasp superfamily ATP-dependent carboligase
MVLVSSFNLNSSMQTQHIPILIFAQSGRFLAESATQSGYRVWAADCYGDTDLLTVVERWQPLPPFAELTHETIIATLSELTRGEQCLLMCGSGIEYCYHLLFPLPVNIQLIGNTPDTVHTIKTPALFFDLLDQYDFNYPDTQFDEMPCNDLTWLKKQASGLGGTHIQYAMLATDKIGVDYYYQRFVSGNSGSCLFLADGHHARLVSINRQQLAPDNQQPFRLGGIESAWQLSASHIDYLDKVVNQLTVTTALVGLNSLDFIISDLNKLLILEINPRVSASAELVNNTATLFRQHLNACLGQLPRAQSILNQSGVSLFYHYAMSDLIIPDNMLWPVECHDLPAPGLTIKQGEPICTSRVEPDENAPASQLHQLIKQSVLKQLITAT